MGPARDAETAALSQRMAWAYSHPVRARAMVILGSRVASPKEIAEQIGEPLGKVSYHIRELRDAKLIELVETDGSRGGVQHFYRAALLPILRTESMRHLSPGDRAVGSAVVINLMVADVAAAVEANTFDSRAERVLVRYHSRVDQRGLDELAELYTDTMYRSIEIHEESVERISESGEPSIPVAMHTLVFEMPQDSAEEPLEETMKTTLEWRDGGDAPIQEGGGSEGRRSDEGDPQQ